VLLADTADSIGRNNAAASMSHTASSSFGGFLPTPNAVGAIGFESAASSTQYFSNATHLVPTVWTNASETQPFNKVGFSTTTTAIGFGDSRPMAVAQRPTSSFMTNQPVAAQSTQAMSSRSIFDQQTVVNGATAAMVSGSASSQIYTPVEQLADGERLQFESAKFTLGNVPVKPPPRLHV